MARVGVGAVKPLFEKVSHLPHLTGRPPVPLRAPQLRAPAHAPLQSRPLGRRRVHAPTNKRPRRAAGDSGSSHKFELAKWRRRRRRRWWWWRGGSADSRRAARPRRASERDRAGGGRRRRHGAHTLAHTRSHSAPGRSPPRGPRGRRGERCNLLATLGNCRSARGPRPQPPPGPTAPARPPPPAAPRELRARATPEARGQPGHPPTGTPQPSPGRRKSAAAAAAADLVSLGGGGGGLNVGGKPSSSSFSSRSLSFLRPGQPAPADSLGSSPRAPGGRRRQRSRG